MYVYDHILYIIQWPQAQFATVPTLNNNQIYLSAWCCLLLAACRLLASIAYELVSKTCLDPTIYLF